jgi:hypothetical protein
MLRPEQFSHNGGNVKRKSSDRVEVAKVPVTAAAAGIASAAERIGPMVHHAADRVGPLAQSAADKVGPMAQSAADKVAPLAQHAVDRVSPYAYQVVGHVSPYAHQAAGRVVPLATTARVRGSKMAHDAADKIGPRLDEAWVIVAPVVEAGRERVNEDLLPRVTGALTTVAASPLVIEAGKRGRATLAAARGELEFPEVEEKKKGSWVRRIALLAALAGIAVFAAKKLLGSKDADWQAARPTSGFPTAKPAGSPTPTTESTSKTGGPLNWAEATGQTARSEPLDEASEQAIVEHVGEPSDLPAEAAPEATVAESVGEESPTEESPTTEASATDGMEGTVPESDQSQYEGDDVYVGSDPPEGFVIKGNESSKKYHLPDSSGYVRTVAEVWFRTEEAAQAAGYTRAQR